MAKDFGYFGKDKDGYVHYMQTFNENSDGKKVRTKLPASGNWALILLIVYLVLYVLSFFFD